MPAVANGVVYVAGTDGGMYGYATDASAKCAVSSTARTCSPLWSKVTGYGGGGSPAIVGSTVYINAEGVVYAYSL